jgi:Tol biopolymer transport system component
MDRPDAGPGTLRAGERIGPYEVTGPLGAGGMGEVYRARDTRLGREVAIKVLPASLAADPDRQRRFEIEARAVAALAHPNVLVVHDVGAHDGHPFIVTELLEGESLRDRLRQGQLPRRKAVEVAVQIARGIAAAHEKGIVHRDLKPDNVYLTRDGRAKVLDFGLARIDTVAVDREGETATVESPGTSPGVVLGTVAYMSPEQARGRPADARSDVFALGAVLYEMLSGSRPFAGASTAETLSAILREDPPPIEAAAGSVPVSLDRIVRRCLEKEPSERFQTARDVGFVLEALAQPSDSAASRPGLATPEPAPARRPLGKLGLGAAMLVLGGALALGTRALVAPPAPPRIAGWRPITGGSYDRIDRFATDGERLYFTVGRDAETRQMSLAGGASAPLTLPFRAGFVVDASKALASLLMVGWDDAVIPYYEAPLWAISLPAGGARKLGVSAYDAAWSPDGRRLAFVNQAKPARVGVARGDGSDARTLFETQGDDTLLWVGWSPAGDRLRFSLIDAGTLECWIYDIPAEGGPARRLFRGTEGDWAPDGRTFVFGAGRGSSAWGWAPNTGTGDRFDLFAVAESRWRAPEPAPFTFGPVHLRQPEFAGKGGPLLARGVEWRARPLRFDRASSRFERLAGLERAAFIDYSRDGRWVAWVDARDLTIWRSRRDGSSPLQLTAPPMAAGIVRWSPDGTQLAFVGKPPESLARIYVVSAAGGPPEALSAPEKGHVWDPCWLPDGSTVVWGRIEGGGVKARDRRSESVSVLPGTEDLWYPKCSPQGLLLTTRGGDTPQATFATYDPRTGRREDLGVSASFEYPNFTRDGLSVVAYNRYPQPGLYQLTLSDRRVRKVADLGGIRLTAPVYSGNWVGLDPEDAPILLEDTSTYEIYALDWQQP